MIKKAIALIFLIIPFLFIGIIINVNNSNTYTSLNTSEKPSNGLESDNIGVHYPNPSNSYEKAIEELNNYVPVFETNKASGSVIYHGEAFYKVIDGKKVYYKVNIYTKHPFVVYHEMGHVLNPDWSDIDCDRFAYSKGFNMPYNNPIYDD